MEEIIYEGTQVTNDTSADVVQLGFTFKAGLSYVYNGVGWDLTAESAAKVAAATAQTDATKANAGLASAVSTLNAVTVVANNANAIHSDMASDGKLTGAEKLKLLTEWTDTLANRQGLLDHADVFSVTTERTAFTTALTAWGTYLNAGVTWETGTPSRLKGANLGVTEAIVAVDMRTASSNLSSAVIALYKAISVKAKAASDAAAAAASAAAAAASAAAGTANWSGIIDTGGKPVDFATRNTGIFAELSGKLPASTLTSYIAAGTLSYAYYTSFDWPFSESYAYPILYIPSVPWDVQYRIGVGAWVGLAAGNNANFQISSSDGRIFGASTVSNPSSTTGMFSSITLEQVIKVPANTSPLISLVPSGSFTRYAAYVSVQGVKV